MYADVDVKTAIDRGEVPGPHLFVATRAMAPTGMYPLRGYSWELSVPHGVQVVDGVEGARLAVREQVSHGADLIKYYSDRAYFYGPDGTLHSRVNFTDEEAKAIVEESHRLGRPSRLTPSAAMVLPPRSAPGPTRSSMASGSPRKR